MREMSNAMHRKQAAVSEAGRGHARRLRRDSTVPERILWGVLRNRALGGLKFRRQQPIGPFIVDFFCHEARLIAELDGESHTDRLAEDQRRQRFLEQQGYRVFRVTNDDVLDDLEAVARGIAAVLGVSFE